MNKIITIVLASVLVSSAAMAADNGAGPGVTASGGYTGPGTIGITTTVADALKAPDDTKVELQGRITRQIRKDLYEFQDSTGTIQVDIDDDLWPPQKISENTVIRIYGEVDVDWSSREIDVDRIQIITP